MAIPLLDHVISNLKERFDDRNQIISKINNLLSLNIIGVDKQELKTLCTEIKEFYNQDITNTFEEELYLWQEKWKNVENEKRPKNSIENLKNCNEDLYPSILIFSVFFV